VAYACIDQAASAIFRDFEKLSQTELEALIAADYSFLSYLAEQVYEVDELV
jgi:collagenase-like PrtC family protease